MPRFLLHLPEPWVRAPALCVPLFHDRQNEHCDDAQDRSDNNHTTR